MQVCDLHEVNLLKYLSIVIKERIKEENTGTYKNLGASFSMCLSTDTSTQTPVRLAKVPQILSHTTPPPELQANFPSMLIALTRCMAELRGGCGSISN